MKQYNEMSVIGTDSLQQSEFLLQVDKKFAVGYVFGTYHNLNSF